MKHFLLLLLCAISPSLQAQDSSVQKTVLQHSLSACMQAHTFSTAYGIRYDLRLHTPNPKTDWAFGATTALGTLNYKFDQPFSQGTSWKQDIDYLTLHGLLVFGVKNFAFQTGLVFGFHDTKERRYNITNYPNQPSFYYESRETNQYITGMATAGLRYQSPKNKIHAWFDIGGGGYLNLVKLRTNQQYMIKQQAVFPGIRLQVGIGYTFLSREQSH
jgi:hypothetical protein